MIDQDTAGYVRSLGRAAREAATVMATVSSKDKNRALELIAQAITDARAQILAANEIDLARARERDLASALLDRLELTPARIQSMVAGLRAVAGQDDPIGVMSETRRQPSGLEIAKMRVPLGVIGVIYESRPNVTADAAALCIKSGNAVILRGGSEAVSSNLAIAECVRQGLQSSGLPAHCTQIIETTDRQAVGELLAMDEYVDAIIPRGGKRLIQRVSEDARVPVIKHLDGICHTFIDSGADPVRAVKVALNAKTYRYGICGAMETLLLHAAEANDLLPALVKAFAEKGVELRGCERTVALAPQVASASEADWNTEYLAPVLSVRIVGDMDEAIDHIAQYGSGHTDAIITESITRAREFVRRVDSSSVMVNAATCFADGAEYGLGAEIGISTNRMHVRGPVGAFGLTTEKYVVNGDYTIRQ